MCNLIDINHRSSNVYALFTEEVFNIFQKRDELIILMNDKSNYVCILIKIIFLYQLILIVKNEAD